MSSLAARLAVVFAVVVAAVGAPGLVAASDSAAGDHSAANPPPAEADTPATPQFAALYPNPVAEGDPGEFVAVEFPEPTDVGGWTIRDGGHGEVRLPNRTVEGTVAFSTKPAAAARHTDHDVLPLEGRLRLANGGDRVELRTEAGVAVATASYDRAPEAELYERRSGDWAWRPLGATAFEPVALDPDAATPFLLPDAPSVPIERLRAADDRLLLAGYTLSSDRVVEALRSAHRRGVEVAVLVEGAPVGGLTEPQAAALDRLSEDGIEVRALGGDGARYRNHHAKYAVVDDEAIVTTENWKPGGVGGASSRGWGVVLHDPEAADALAEVFRADARWRDAIPWERYRTGVDPVPANASDGTYPSRFEPEQMPVERARLLVAPDNAESELRDLLASAEESIRIQQVRIGGLDDPLLSATVAAARRGVEVEILLGGAWYVADENRALADDLAALAAEEDLPLSVELVEPRSRFGKVHAKGVIVDDRHVVVGSANWNEVAFRENREVLVVLTGEAVVSYYARAFRADRRGGVWRLPLGLTGGVALAWLGVGAIAATRR